MSLEMQDLFSLEGRVSLVTGASGHLGGALAEALCAAGARVYLLGRREAVLRERAGALCAAGHDARALVCDVRDDAAGREALSVIARESGRLDVLVSNAHVGRTGAFTEAVREDFAEGMDLAVGSAHALTLAALPLLKSAAKDGSPSVIHVASIYGMVSPDPRNYATPSQQNPAYYGAAKAALIQYARHAAVHLAGEGVRVNALSPGPFPGPSASEALLEKLRAKVPLGRVGVPEELATALLFLASPRSSYVTGVNLPVDGGFTAW